MLQLVEHSRALQLVADSIMQKTLICQQIKRFGVSQRKPENKKPFTKNFTGRVQLANFRFVGRAAPGIDTYQIIFRSSLDNHIPIDGVKSCTTIYELKKMIQAKLGAPTESMRLVSSNLIFDQSQNQIKFRHNFFN